jgi:hypothetical protein
MMVELIESFSKLFIPDEIRTHFECKSIEEIGDEIYLICYEKDDSSHIPKEILRVGKVVLDGYRNKVDIQTFPAQGKEVYIRLYRRKWKLKKAKEGYEKSYSNSYSFTEEGIRSTKEFGAFLKEIGR